MAQDEKRREQLLARAKAALGQDASPEARKAIEVGLEKLAAELALEWLLGESRFESQSQQTEYWLSRFYEDLFIDEQPEPTRIYQRFGLNLPKAAYLARLLRARRSAHWRQAARRELRAQIERHKPAAIKAREAKQAHVTEFDLSLSPGAADELKVVYDSIAAFSTEKERPRPPSLKTRFTSARWLAVPADTLLLILDKLAAEDPA